MMLIANAAQAPNNKNMQQSLAPPGSLINLIRTGPRGGTPVVLIHAVGVDLTLWGPQIEALQADYDVVALDLPGHGLSAPLTGEPSFERFGAALVQVIESLGAGPAHLVGISFGGRRCASGPSSCAPPA